MSSLVLQLQTAAMDRNVAIADLLRMARATAAKLGVSEIEEWLRHELDGYGEAPVPEYRKVHGELKAHNPYRGWLPVEFPNAEAQERYSIGILEVFKITSLVSHVSLQRHSHLVDP
jgi:AbiTii